MKILLFVSALVLLGCTGRSQNIPAYTFDIEKLQLPAGLLKEESADVIYKKLLFQDAGYGKLSQPPASYDPLTGIIAKYKNTPALVNFGYHSFFDGMYHAYAEHRPFTLSPDMIWLLIMQGFSQHVNNNQEQLRKLFVKHDGKITLIVQNNSILLDDPDSPWEEVFPEFTTQIEKHTGSKGLKDLVADFTTTTPVTRLASQVTLMDAMKKYFEYLVMVIGCGIPSVTLEGTPQDWKHLLQKTRSLKKYELDWWITELEPILEEFVNASEKKVDKDFWRSMFKYHEVGGVYKSKMIDGWIVKFFPYDKSGKRNGLDSLASSSNLPDEICKVDLLHQLVDTDGNISSTPLELWAGFTGLQQDKATLMLKPEIGWMIKRADSLNNEVVKQLAARDRIEIRVSEIPRELLALKKVKFLSVTFIGNIVIPDEMKNIEITHLQLRGSVSEKEAERIAAMFPNTELYINNKTYGKNTNAQGVNLGAGW